jgi:hypothetical protein
VLRGFPDRTPRTRGPDATASIAAETLQEAVAAWLQSSFSSTLPPVAGLAGGTLTSRQTSFRLTRYALVPDVALTGTLTLTSAGPPFSVDGSVRVSGAGAAAGTLTVAGGKLTGVLGGHSVHG